VAFRPGADGANLRVPRTLALPSPPMRVLWAALAVVVADQLTKIWVRTSMDLYESIPVVGRLFRFTFTENPGMAFGLSLGSKLFLTVFSLVATALIGLYLWHVRRAPTSYRLALALVLGGAFGNIIDRVFYGVVWDYAPLLYGNVVDFLHVDLSVLFADGNWPAWLPAIGGDRVTLFPIGNIADLAIIAGVVLIMFTQKGAQTALQAYAAPAESEVATAEPIEGAPVEAPAAAEPSPAPPVA